MMAQPKVCSILVATEKSVTPTVTQRWRETQHSMAHFLWLQPIGAGSGFQAYDESVRQFFHVWVVLALAAGRSCIDDD